jgi:hypothetical protein
MKRYTNMEILAAICGLVFIIFGLVMIFHPTEMNMISPGFGAGRYKGISGSNKPVHISKAGSQVYGGLLVVMGSGIFWVALFTGQKR